MKGHSGEAGAERQSLELRWPWIPDPAGPVVGRKEYLNLKDSAFLSPVGIIKEFLPHAVVVKIKILV